VHDEEEEMQLAETLKLLQGKVPKLNVDVTIICIIVIIILAV
jgi:hypothetical protein